MVYMFIPPRYKRPQIYIEEPRRLTVPITISKYPRPPTSNKSTRGGFKQNVPAKLKSSVRQWYRKRKTVNELKKKEHQKDISQEPRRTFRKKEPAKCTSKCSIRQWFRQRKALKELRNSYKKELLQKQQEELERAIREHEKEVLNKLRKEAAEAAAAPKTAVYTASPVNYEKKSHAKERTVTARPRASSKYVSVKQPARYRETLSERFVNCCYRVCCQFYCCMTCIFIIGFAIIYLLPI